MNKSVFITDADTLLGSELTRLYISGGSKVIATVGTEDAFTSVNKASGLEADIPLKTLSDLKNKNEESLMIVLWHRQSPVSTKNIFLRLLTQFDSIDEVLLFGNPVQSAPALHLANFELINEYVDSYTKGTLYLLKEILTHYQVKKTGLLALICLNSNHSSSPLEEIFRRGFLGLCHSLLNAYANEEFKINAFESSADFTENFAAEIEGRSPILSCV